MAQVPAKVAPRMPDFPTFYEQVYKREHQKRSTRVLHVMGTLGAMAIGAAAVATRRLRLFPLGIITGYGFAWVGHFLFEKNRPATFKYPLWSLRADFLMFWNILTGREALGPAAAA